MANELHGRTTIQFTDVHTGESETIVSDNLVTNFMSDLLTTHVGSGYVADYLLGGLLDSYGGLFLFADVNGGSESDYALNPSSITGIGNQSASLDSAHLKHGIYNSALSYVAEGICKMVWDFDAEHSNGTIASVSLAPVVNTGFYLDANQGNNTSYTSSIVPIGRGNFEDPMTAENALAFCWTDPSFVPIAFDHSTQTLYACAFGNNALTIKKIPYGAVSPIRRTIMKSQRQWDNWSVLSDAPNNFTTYKNTATYVVSLTNYSTASPTGGILCADPETGYLYAGLCSNIAPNGQVSLAKIKLSDGTTTAYTLTNNSDRTIEILKNFVYHGDTTAVTPSNCAIIHSGMFIFNSSHTNGSTKYYKPICIKVSDNSTYCAPTIAYTGACVTTGGYVPYGFLFSKSVNTGLGSAIRNGNASAGAASVPLATFAPYGKNAIIVCASSSGVVSTDGQSSNNAGKNVQYILSWDDDASITESNNVAAIRSVATACNNDNWFGLNYNITRYAYNLIPIIGKPSVWLRQRLQHDKPALIEYAFKLPHWDFWICSHNVQTINDLDSAVVKTADRTMRVTYTIADEEGLLSVESEGDN